MNKYTCFVCREEFETDEEIPEVSEDQALLCQGCSETVFRLTGISGEDIG